MIQSMTGFAARTFIFELDKEKKVNVSITIKALNSRFFEASCKLPYILTAFEHDFTKILKATLKRGYIYLTIHMSNQSLLKESIEPSFTIIDGYIKAVDKIKENFSLEGNLSLHDLLKLPSVFNVEEKNLDPAAVKKITEVVRELVKEVVVARKKEGVALKTDLEERLAIMGQEIIKIEKDVAVLLKKRKENIEQELRELEKTDSDMIDARRQMLYTALDKSDIHEEIIRFKSHLENLSSILNSDSIEKGKRIDFTLQELAREINTIAAKCSDVAVSSLAINVKVELEKAREQTQNVL